MNDLDLYKKEQGRQIARTDIDPFLAEGQRMGAVGQYLTFNRFGEWVSGQDQTIVPVGTLLVANMPQLRKGWRRWSASQITDDLTELVAEGRGVPPRNSLGDIDQSLWERDGDGKPRDPWQLSYILELSNGTTNYIYDTGSKGGMNAVGRLCTAYGKERRARPGMLPIIELGTDSYQHPVYKKTFVPLLRIEGWTDENNPSLDDTESEDEIPFDLPAVKPASRPAVKF